MKKNSIIILIIIAIGIISIIAIKGFSDEDSWICENGQWLKHGHPSAPMPTNGCAVLPLACPMDAKICSDGTTVGRMAPKCDFALCPKEDLIVVETPKPNEIISSPLKVLGKARGTWYFEGNFPIKLFSEDGKLLAQTEASAKGEWMTTDFVDFEGSLTFTTPTSSKGFLVLEKSNPSGLAQNADELRIPVLFK